MEKKDSSSPGFGLKGWVVAIGHGLAFAQHETDRLVKWGFSQLKKNRIQQEPEPKPSTGKISKILRVGKRGVATGIRTLGLLGDSYFERYEELKRKEKGS